MSIQNVNGESTKTVLKYLNLYQKLKKNRMNLDFNKTCNRKNLIPSYINVKIKCQSASARNTKNKAEKIWLRDVIKKLYNVINIQTCELYNTQLLMSKIFHQIEYENIVQKTAKITEVILTQKRRIMKNKMRRLWSSQKTTYTSYISSPPTHKFHPRLVNNTTINFTVPETELIHKGLKHNLSPINNHDRKKRQLLNIESAINKTTSVKRDIIRHEIVFNIINKPGLNHFAPHHEMKIAKNIQNKISDNKAYVTKADKGNTTVIMYEAEYIEKVNQYIRDNNIHNISYDPTNKYKTTINQAINCSNLIIDTHRKHNLKMIKPKAPQFRGLPKIHKDGTPIRPLINYRTAPAFKLSKHIHAYLNNKLNLNVTTSVKNSIELINNIQKFNIPNNGKLASFDIKNMYGNIPVKETIELIRTMLTDLQIPHDEINQAIKLLQIITAQNYFTFNNKYYKQMSGLPMGNPLSGTLAEIYLTNLEQKFILNQQTNTLRTGIIYWFRYVDDILLLFNGTSRQLKMLHNYINNIHPNIKFTLEEETSKSINFLDITIKNNNNKHELKIYRKPTQTNHTIHATSNHPIQQKQSAYYHMITRLNKIKMKETDYMNELCIIKNIAKSNGYTEVMIDKMNRKYKHKEYMRSLSTHTTMKDEEQRKYITIEFDKTLPTIANKIFRQHGYTIAYKTNNKLEYKINTTHTPNQCNTGVYRLNCDDCECFYIGQTGRDFHTRFTEHVREIGKSTITSNFASHLTEQQHKYTSFNHNLNILYTMQKGDILDRTEEVNIYKHRHNQFLLNDKIPYNGIYELYLSDDRTLF